MSIDFTTDKVSSADGTTIGYRQTGNGPGLILVHGAMMVSQNFSQLATALADMFTVYIPDRRGRGLSGPHGSNYCLDRECEDMQAIVHKTRAQNIFGLSSGAIVALESAFTLPDAIRKVALYEPPFAVNGSAPDAWSPRFDAELTKGDLGAAMVTVMKGTGDSSLLNLLPRFLLVPFMRFAIEADAKETQGDAIPLKALIPTVHFDPQLVRETANKLDHFKALQANVLLLGGSQSQGYLKVALNALDKLLPRVERIEFPGLGHLAATDQGQPQRVAQELRRFFAEK